MTRAIALANQKGGVGKTTTSINLATALAATGHRTLLIDLDSQGNAATGLGMSARTCAATSYDILLGELEIDQAASETQIPGLHLIPGGEDLVGVEARLNMSRKHLYRLRERIDSHRRTHLTDGDGFDFILTDCPPSLSAMTMNAMTAADAVLVPIQCEFLALEGLTQLLRTVDFVRENTNPDLEIQGVVLTMYDARTRHAHDVANDVRKHLGAKVYDTVIPRNVRLSEAPSFGKPAVVYDYHCAGSQAYIRLAGEMIKREREKAA